MKSYLVAFLFIQIVLFVSCDAIEDSLLSESEKRIKTLTEGGSWKVDSLVLKSDILNGGISTITSDSLVLNAGSLTFKSPEETPNPGYNAGFAFHSYSLDGETITDTLAWVPYNFNSGSDNHITIFYDSGNNVDFVTGAYDMYFDILKLEDNVVRIESWRRESSPNGNGVSYGNFKRYHLSR